MSVGVGVGERVSEGVGVGERVSECVGVGERVSECGCGRGCVWVSGWADR